jgi:hypothetical protein
MSKILVAREFSLYEQLPFLSLTTNAQTEFRSYICFTIAACSTT